MSGFLNDLRFGLRQLVKRPGFAAAAILTLALGIGANTAVFSLLSGYLFKPLPYTHGDRLAQVEVKMRKLEASPYGMSLPVYQIIQKQTSSFAATAVYYRDDFGLTARGRGQYIYGVVGSASLFRVLGVQPMLGRAFSKADMQERRNRVVLINYALWQGSFGADPSVIGKTVKIEGNPYKIIGVMPKGFAFPDRDTSLWMPTAFSPKDFEPRMFGRRSFWSVIGRLKADVSVSATQRQVQQAFWTWAGSTLPIQAGSQRIDEKRLRNEGFDLQAQSYHQVLLGNRPATLWLLQGAVLLILLITCVNVANLLLSRTLGRSHEMAMRSALGATRGVLARQLLIEALCLTVPGGSIGIGLAWLGVHFMASSALGGGASIFSIALDWRVGLFALGAVVFTAALVSVLPIRHLAKTDLQGLLQEGSRTSSGGRGAKRVRNALVVAELTLATGLLAMAGLLLHSFMNIEAVNPGFRKDHILFALLEPTPTGFSSREALSNFYKNAAKRVQTLPGVVQAAISDGLPLGGMDSGTFSIPGRETSASGKPPEATMDIISPGYFKALGIPLLRGRDFDQRDAKATRAIVDAALVKTYLPDVNPIGQKIKMGDTITIVGVVPTVKNAKLSQTQPAGTVYINIAKNPSTDMYLVMHTALPPTALIKPVKQLLSAMVPRVIVSDVHTMHEQLSDSLSDRQTTMTLLLAFGGIALALAIVGVYAVMSYAVGQRRPEFGVRLALGAVPEDLLWLVFKDGLKLLAIGLVVGLGLAVVFGYILSSQLFGVAPFDPLTLIGSAVVLCAITLAACYLPARRAANLDPAIAIMEQ